MWVDTVLVSSLAASVHLVSLHGGFVFDDHKVGPPTPLTPIPTHQTPAAQPEPGQPDPKPGHHMLPKDTMSHPERGGAPPGAPQVPWKGARCGAGSARGTAAARRTQPNQGHRSLQMDTNARSERGEAPTSALKALWCELQGQDSRK